MRADGWLILYLSSQRINRNKQVLNIRGPACFRLDKNYINYSFKNVNNASLNSFG